MRRCAERLHEGEYRALPAVTVLSNRGVAVASEVLGHAFRYFVVMKRFIIVHEPTEFGIRVARILHGMRNLAAVLDRDAGDDGRGP